VRRCLILILSIYLIGGLCLVRFYQYQINPDAVSYLSVAQKYAAGNLKYALNSFWPPLLSWSLVPFLIIGIKPILSAKIFSLLLGATTIMGVEKLSYKFEISSPIRKLMLFSLVPIVWYFAFWVISPDLLLLTIFVYYFNIILGKNYIYEIKNSIFCGILGGLAYLAKPYGLFFFISHFSFFSLIYYLKEKNKKRIKNYLVGLAFFIAIVFFWNIILSINNRKPTLQMLNYAHFTYAYVGPGPINFFNFLDQGFILPPNKEAISIWEDPSKFDIKSWSPLNSWQNSVYELRLIKINSILFIQSLTSFSFLSIPIIIIFVFVLINKFSKRSLLGKTLFPFYTIIFFLPSIFIHIDERYLWTIDVLVLTILSILLSKLSKPHHLIYILFFLTFLIHPIKSLALKAGSGKDIYKLSSSLSQNYNIPEKSNIASNTNSFETLYVVFHLKSKYFNNAKMGISPQELISELEKNNIDYYFVWDKQFENYDYLDSYNEITQGQIPGLRVYHLKRN